MKKKSIKDKKINTRKRRYERQESMHKKDKGVKKSIWEKEKLSACYDGRGYPVSIYSKNMMSAVK